MLRVASRGILAHRFAYELLVGPIPDGLHTDHLCRNHSCVRPDHLEPVTCAVNVQRGIGPAALNAKKAHCMHGHPFDGPNTMIAKNGKRQCRTCHNLRGQRAKRAAREAARVGRTRCKRGHPIEEHGYPIAGHGSMGCRACKREDATKRSRDAANRFS